MTEQWLTPVPLPEFAVGETGIDDEGHQVKILDSSDIGIPGNKIKVEVLAINKETSWIQLRSIDDTLYRIQQPINITPDASLLDTHHRLARLEVALADMQTAFGVQNTRIGQLDSKVNVIDSMNNSFCETWDDLKKRVTELEASNRGICMSGMQADRNIQALNEVVNQFKERLDVLENHRVAVFPALIAEAEGARSIEIQALCNRVMALEQPATTGAYTTVTSKHYAEIVAERDSVIRERDRLTEVLINWVTKRQFAAYKPISSATVECLFCDGFFTRGSGAVDHHATTCVYGIAMELTAKANEGKETQEAAL